MGQATLTASQLIDQDGTPLNGSVFLANSTGQEQYPVTNGAISVSVPSDTYTSLWVDSTYYQTTLAQLSNVTLTDGETLQLDAPINGAWAAQVGTGWQPLTGQEDLLVISAGPVALPPMNTDAQEIEIVNSGAATNVTAPVPIGNGASPAQSISLPALACLWLRYQLSTNTWRVLSLSTASQ